MADIRQHSLKQIFLKAQLYIVLWSTAETKSFENADWETAHLPLP